LVSSAQAVRLEPFSFFAGTADARNEACGVLLV
jgi:hypothetical protein